MTQPLEIEAPAFTEERYGVIVRAIEKRLEATYPGRFDYPHFFRTWREIMALGIARTWEAPGALLGVTFTQNIFTGDFNANVVFWWATEEGRKGGGTLALLKAAEAAAREHNCRLFSSAAYGEMDSDLMEKLYKRKGYTKSETIFRKEIK